VPFDVSDLKSVSLDVSKQSRRCTPCRIGSLREKSQESPKAKAKDTSPPPRELIFYFADPRFAACGAARLSNG
jgi:hypothetical protein